MGMETCVRNIFTLAIRFALSTAWNLTLACEWSIPSTRSLFSALNASVWVPLGPANIYDAESHVCFTMDTAMSFSFSTVAIGRCYEHVFPSRICWKPIRGRPTNGHRWRAAIYGLLLRI